MDRDNEESREDSAGDVENLSNKPQYCKIILKSQLSYRSSQCHI